MGVKRVKTGTAINRNIAGREKNKHGIYSSGLPNPGIDVGYADADGLETVEAWECHEDCPVGMFAAFGTRMHSAGAAVDRGRLNHAGNDDGVIYGRGLGESAFRYGDEGSPARFFYTSKAGRRERWFYCRDCADAFPPDTRPDHQHGHAKDGKEDWSHITSHPTQKPLALMTWLVKLVAREGELVLDPFAGSGTTVVACVQTGRRFIGIEQDAAYHAIAQKRIAAAQAEAGLFAQQEVV